MLSNIDVLNNITYGADPEVSAGYISKGEIHCIPPIAFETLKGVKPVIEDEKHPVYIDTNLYQWHMDGASFELRLKHPYNSFIGMMNTVTSAINNLKSWLKNYGYFLCTRPTVKFDTKRFWEKQDQRFQQCVIFGCDEDYDIFNPNYVCETVDVSTYPYRHNGGHLHIGHRDINIVKVFHNYLFPFMQLLTIYVGAACLAYTKYPNEEKVRKEKYGSPGRYRLTDYGIEYRSPSNSWINNNLYNYSRISDSIEHGIRNSVYLLMNPKKGKEMINTYFESANKAILETDVNLAKRILSSSRLGYYNDIYFRAI